MDKDRMQELAGVVINESQLNEGVEDKIFSTLMNNEFVTWYESVFMDFVEGEDNAPSKEVILKDIKQMFGV